MPGPPEATGFDSRPHRIRRRTQYLKQEMGRKPHRFPMRGAQRGRRMDCRCRPLDEATADQGSHQGLAAPEH
jgi:hypothetical protein